MCARVAGNVLSSTPAAPQAQVGWSTPVKTASREELPLCHSAPAFPVVSFEEVPDEAAAPAELEEDVAADEEETETTSSFALPVVNEVLPRNVKISIIIV